MSNINHKLYTFEDKTSDEVLLINGFQHINQLIPYVNQLQQERDLYKEVIEEVREYAKSHFKTMVADEEAQGLLQILDKVTNYKPVSLEEFDEYVASDNEELWED